MPAEGFFKRAGVFLLMIVIITTTFLTTAAMTKKDNPKVYGYETSIWRVAFKKPPEIEFRLPESFKEITSINYSLDTNYNEYDYVIIKIVIRENSYETLKEDTIVHTDLKRDNYGHHFSYNLLAVLSPQDIVKIQDIDIYLYKYD